MHQLLGTAAIAVALALPAHASPYTLFVYEDQAQLDLRPGTGSNSLAYWSAYDAFGKQLAAAGVLRGGSALNTTDGTMHVSEGSAHDSASAYASSDMALGGYFQIDVATKAEAVKWAQKAPLGGKSLIEVRAAYPVPMINQ